MSDLFEKRRIQSQGYDGKPMTFAECADAVWETYQRAAKTLRAAQERRKGHYDTDVERATAEAEHWKDMHRWYRERARSRPNAIVPSLGITLLGQRVRAREEQDDEEGREWFP